LTGLSGRARKLLRGKAHALSPVVRIGRAGLTPSIEREVAKALESHELIKVHIEGGRADRAATASDLATAAEAEIVGAIGGVVILFRQNPDPEKRRLEI
jgi:RNA-binding protein